MTAEQQLRLAFYGDDFTGSTDALEVLAFAGLRCALFLKPPSAELLDTLGNFDAIGVAGDSRSMSPEEMDQALPDTLSALASLPVSLVHYKVCSTFDSSPTVGSIGRVMDLARDAFGRGPIPIVAATPALGRYCVFGNLFARSGTDGVVYRLDRHPIMSRHPTTPMTEADLAAHLGAQTRQVLAKFTLASYEEGQSAMDAELARLASSGADGIVFDGTTSGHLTQVGRLLEQLGAGRSRPLFCIGSSGLEYAATQWWRENGTAEPTSTPQFERFRGVETLLAVSGSASPLSKTQVDKAIETGFVDIRVDAASLVADEKWESELSRLHGEAVAALRAGRSVIAHTARGPDDDRIKAMTSLLESQGMRKDQAKHLGGRLLAQRLGRFVDGVLREVRLERVVISGGDTSSHVTRQLAPDALVVAARLAPGAPLCRVISDQPHLSDLEIALKGGQMGNSDYFVKALRGTEK
ncbi:MAG: type III effector [Cupriavidus sp.]|uniref:four-carbon acid sugar kinase family protein n=2 Tax=Cupriavidus pauculus TaxID=82633 RepID=UPI000C3E99D8|nr:four-carbon acid sugar kinase family protein [Cupriavidus pauculus]KAB0601727.1 four-carbon acid sugar kinase family protein [Cupriavidus pauculus]MBU70119.1 type III effector [Cupriavidus sp.]UAL02039.1 four-carbon acid sugar kinase family protein [Cupriavidus pauculus]